MRDDDSDEEEGSDSAQQQQPAAKRQRLGNLGPGGRNLQGAAEAAAAGSGGAMGDALGGQSSGRRPSLLDAYIVQQPQSQQEAGAPGAHQLPLPDGGLGAAVAGAGGVPVVKSSR